MSIEKHIWAFSTFSIPLEPMDNVQFSFLNVIAETVRPVNPAGQILLRIRIHQKIESFDSAHENSRYSRPKLLVALGILSFVTGRDFTIYDIIASQSSSVVENISLEEVEARCQLYGRDYSKDLKSICQTINNETGSQNTLLFSLLDRWRKAQHQFLESEGEGLFEDESLLSFFHVLELMAGEYQRDQVSEAESKISLFLIDLISGTFKFRGSKLDEKVREKTRIMKDVLLGGDSLSVGSRINYMLEQQGLLNDRVQYLIAELISARNSIAHGRQVFRESLIWPLPPYFMLHSNHFNLGGLIRILTAKVISSHYQLDLWTDEWNDALTALSPPIDVIKNFIACKHYAHLTTEQFCSGAISSVTPASIIEAYIKRKINLSDIEQALEGHIEGIIVNSEMAGVGDPVYIMIILADVENLQLSELCKISIQKIHDSQDFERSNIKDYLRFLEFHSIKPGWFREWIASGMRYGLGKPII
ncbi:TPA: hypothetical protein SLP05_001938 [Pseudomonas putida]|nr:hypothetical protein [Pseudomonas putida]